MLYDVITIEERRRKRLEIYERIRELRKKHLKMSMEVFGEKLGVSRDVLAALLLIILNATC